MNLGRMLRPGFGVLAVVVLTLFPVATGFAEPSPPPARTGEIIVKFKANASQADRQAILADLGADEVTTLPRIGANQARIMRATVDEAIRRYRGNSKVEFIEPNYIYRASLLPDDPSFPSLWAMQNAGQTGGTPGADISATRAWDVTTGSSSVLVGVIDTGIDYTHPDLAGNVFTNPGEIPDNHIDDDGNGFVDDVHGYDFVNNDGDPMDDHFHGTHVSGTIGAIGNNGVGVVGVNWHVRIIGIKFLDAGGGGTTDNAVRAIDYAVRMGVKVINASWGGGGQSEALRQAIQSAGEAGVLFVAAAGNSGQDTDVFPSYPASYDVATIISVASSDDNDRRSGFSNYGLTTVDLAAPGENILSTMPFGGYGFLSGTSMATPHVVGTLGLIYARFPNISAMAAKSLLLARVDPVPAFDGVVATGGRLNAFMAVTDPDVIAPGSISDLSVIDVNGTRVKLRWTATGDDGSVGTCSQYELRYATFPINANNFATATRVTGLPRPNAAGALEQFEVHGLPFNTHLYFAIRALDEFANPSPLSNVVNTTTLAPPIVAVSPSSLDVSLLTGQQETRILTISNTGPAEAHVVVRSQQVAGASAAKVQRTFVMPAATAVTPPPGESAPRPYPLSTTPYAQGHTPGRPRLAPSDIRITNLQTAGARVLILHSGTDVTEIQTLLSAFPDLEAVDVRDASLGMPTLAELVPYQSIMLVANTPFPDPDGLGDLLADYVDTGGGLIMTLATTIAGWEIRGRLYTDGYVPFTLGTGPVGSSALGSFDANHPIMAGVHSAFGDLLAQLGVADGATLVASWANGQPCVAVKGTVAAVNVFVAYSGFWSGDIPLLLHNALLWSSAGAWLSADPNQALVPSGGQLGAVVTFNAVDLNGGDYSGSVRVESDDPIHPLLQVPTALHVTGVPDIALVGDELSVESAQDYNTDAAATLHELALPPPPTPTPGTFDLEVDGDFGDFTEIAKLTVEGVELGSVGGTNFDCSSGKGSFTVSGAQLATFLADGKAKATVRNANVVGSFCDRNRHIVRLHYQGPNDRLEFGNVFTGSSRRLGLVIRNAGSEQLVVSSITSTSPAFTPSVTQLSIAPRTFQRITVNFEASQAIGYSGTLRIESDDPDEAVLQVPLTGTGLVPPELTLSPTSFDETLLSGARVSRTLTVRNDGGSDLDYAITIEGSAIATLPVLPGPKLPLPPVAPPPPSTLAAGTAAPAGAATALASGSPGGLEYGTIGPQQAPQQYVPRTAHSFSMSGATVLLIQDYQPWGTASNEAVLQANHLSFDVISTSAVAGVNLLAYQKVIVASDQSTASYQNLTARLTQFTDYVQAGGVLEVHAAGWGYSNGDASQLTLPGGMGVALYNSGYSLLQGDHPLMAGVPNPLQASTVSLAFLRQLPPNALVLATNENGSPVYVTYPMGRGWVIATGHILEFGYAMQGSPIGRLLVNAIPYGLAPATSWLSAAPIEGRIPAGGSQQVTLQFETAGLLGGDYSADLVVHTNDPDEQVVRVPASMHVNTAPDIAVFGVRRSLQSAKSYLEGGQTTNHDFEATIPPAGDGQIELVADGDFGDFTETATLEVEGMRLGEVGRTGIDCYPATGQFVLPAADLARVAADGTIHVSVTNSPDVNTSFCALNQHTVRLVYFGRVDLVDFGQVFVGGNDSLQFQIENRGLEPLHIDPLVPTDPEFHVQVTGPIVLPPRTTLQVPVVFAPTSATHHQALVAVRSDDPDQPSLEIRFVGEGLVPPEIAVTPDHMDEHLLTGQVVERSLTIANTGGAALTYEILFRSAPPATPLSFSPLARSLSAPFTPAAKAATAVQPASAGNGTNSGEGVLIRSNAPPQGYRVLAAHPSIMTGASVLLVEDTLPWGVTSNEQILAADNIPYTTIVTSQLASTDLASFSKVIIASDQPTFSYEQIAAAMPQIEAYVRDGGTLDFHAAGAGFAGGNPSLVTLPGGVGIQVWFAPINYILDPSHPLAAGVPSPFSGTFASHSTLFNLPAQASLVAADDQSRPNLIVYSFGAGTVIASGQTLEYGYASGQPQGILLRNMIPFGGSGGRPDWVTAQPFKGSVPVGATATITLRLDADRLKGGDYFTNVLVRSNDPDESEVTVPIHLAVTGVPDIALSGIPVALESVKSFQTDGARTQHDFRVEVTPQGDGVLELDVDGDFGDFTETATAYLDGVQLGEVGRTGTDCRPASVQFAIPAEQLANAAADALLHVEVQNSPDVNVICAANQHVIRVFYHGPSNLIELGPAFVGLCKTQSVLVVNQGTDVLHLDPLTVSDAAFHVSFEPGASMDLQPHDSLAVHVSFCPLFAGVIQAELTIPSNDPDEARKVVQLRGTGVVPPDVAVSPSSVSQALLIGQEATSHLLVANDGGSPLDYHITIGLISGASSPPARASGVATPLSAEAIQAARDHYRAAGASPVSSSLPAPTVRPAMIEPPIHANELVLFFDDMEHGARGWTHASTSPDGVDQWAMSTLRSSSGSISWRVSPHALQGSEALQSPVIDLGGTSQPKLTFRTWYSFDDFCGSPDLEPDGGIVEIADSDSGWTQIHPINGYPYVLDDVCDNPLASKPAYAHHSSANGAFVTETFDLSAYAGRQVRLRFQAGWDCGNCAFPDGWFVDDVKVFVDSPSWARTQPGAGTVAPGELADVPLIFDAAGLSPGTYQATLRVESNDPDEPRLEVPLRLLVADFAAAIDPDPNTVNLGSRGQSMTMYLELPTGMKPADVTLSSLRLNFVAQADQQARPLGDVDHDGVPDLTLKFPFEQLRPSLGPGMPVPVVLSGALSDGRTFMGIENIKVIRQHVTTPNGGEVLASGHTFNITWNIPQGWTGVVSDLFLSTNRGASWQPIASGVSGSSYAWTVPGIESKHALVRIEIRDAIGVLDSDVSDAAFQIQATPIAVEPAQPAVAQLSLRNSPNPFGVSGTEIEFGLSRQSPVTLTVFSASGRRVRVLLSEGRAAGIHRVRWDGRDERGAMLGSGVYFLRLTTAEGDRTRRIALVR